MKKIFVIIFLLYASANAQNRSKNDELMLKLNKSFEVYGSIYRELLFNYVVDIDPEELMLSGINGMLNALDPYTNYSAPDENEDVDYIMSDKYVGIGIQTDSLDSMLTIVSVYKDSPA